MIELFSKDRWDSPLRSSKGNQLKWQSGDWWYKADYTGYEGLAEYMISHLLQFSTLKEEEYVLYDLEQIQYHEQVLNGAKSHNFMKPGWQIITLERLFFQQYGISLAMKVWSIEKPEDRLRFLVDTTEAMTGLKDFGIYMNKVLTIDALFLNEDRHMHNLAVLSSADGEYRLCPLFDHGAGLMADTTLDYPLGIDPLKMIPRVQAKTFMNSFEDQLEFSERLYGSHIHFSFRRHDVIDMLLPIDTYDEAIRIRVRDLIMNQREKYSYLFS